MGLTDDCDEKRRPSGCIVGSARSVHVYENRETGTQLPEVVLRD
jgi:hypothetical protein